MKKQLLLLVMMLLPMVTMADDTAFVVELTNGQKAEYLLKDKPTLTMEGTQFIISSATVQAGFERSDVIRFYFSTETSGVKEVSKNTLVYRQIDNEQLEIIGLSPDDYVNVYNMSGSPLGNITRTTDRAVVNFSGHQKGVYLIQVGNGQTIKFIKK